MKLLFFYSLAYDIETIKETIQHRRRRHEIKSVLRKAKKSEQVGQSKQVSQNKIFAAFFE